MYRLPQTTAYSKGGVTAIAHGDMQWLASVALTVCGMSVELKQVWGGFVCATGVIQTLLFSSLLQPLSLAMTPENRF